MDRLLESKAIVVAASATSFLIGLVFIFIWAPHPWGWYGIDQYHQLAIDLSQGRGFATLDVPWAYGYFLAFFYRLFGPTPLPALLMQNLLNASIPVVVYCYAVRAFDRRVAMVAAAMVGLLSFNTIYVSTESTDSVCTFLFMLMVWSFDRGRNSRSIWWFVAAGALAGLAAQFRPNLILIPFVLFGLNWLMGPRSWLRAWQGAAIVLMAGLMLAPWTIRNYRLTGQVMPTSTHGGIQLWYGTLQTGNYLESRSYNPKRVFATPPFDYSSLTEVPVQVEVWLNCGPGTPQRAELVYRLGDDSSATVPLLPVGNNRYAGTIPPTRRNVPIYHYTQVQWPGSGAGPLVHATPAGGAADPLVYFVSDDHVGDLDTGDRLLDLFDVVRLLRHLAWQEPVRATAQLDRDHDGALTEADLRANLRIVLGGLDRGEPSIDRLIDVESSDTRVQARFIDGTTLVVPRRWDGLATDLEIGEGMAEAVMSSRHRFAQPYPAPRNPLETQCLGPGGIWLNQPFYRVLPHEMNRYVALAMDNIRREPLAYAWSVLYRAGRLFIVQGSDDRQTTQQFDRSRIVYMIATVASALIFALALSGAWLAWRRGHAVWLPLALILYVPATISFVLTNMRYTITVQPLVLTFAAVSLLALWDAFRRSGGRTSAP